MRTSSWTTRLRGAARAAVVVACVASGAAARAAPARRAGPIDVNSASVATLKTLPGIGDAEARKIVAGRPWVTKADLVLKGVLPEGKYVAIRNRIVAALDTPRSPAPPPRRGRAAAPAPR